MQGGSGRLRRLAEAVVDRPRAVLAATLAFLVVAGVLGAGVADRLKVGGFDDPGSESSQAQKLLDDEFEGTPNLVLQLTARSGTVDDAPVRAAAEALEGELTAAPGLTLLGSYWSTGSAELRSEDGRSGLLQLYVGGTTEERAERTEEIVAALPVDDQAIDVGVGGSLGLTNEINTRVDDDLIRSETVALPTTLVLLIVVFGGVIAALLPLALGVTSILATWLILLALSEVTDVSVYALIVATAFGLGLAIDFGLFMVSRFREERDGGHEPRQAVVEAVATAGETILFSASTIALAMASMLVFPIYFLRSVGLAAIAVVTVAAIGAVVVLPAMLALAGDRVDSLVIFRRRGKVSADSPFWRGIAAAVMRRPALTALPVVALLLLLAVPVLHAQFAPADERALPDDSSVRQVSTDLGENYPTDRTRAISVVAPTAGEGLESLAADLSTLPDVVAVDGPFGRFSEGNRISGPGPESAQFISGDAGYLLVLPSVPAESDAAQSLVRTMRAAPEVADPGLLVGGPSAALIDSRAAVTDRLGLALALVVGAMFVLLFAFTKSIVVPVKAMLLNVLTLGAVLGAMVWLFQDGHLVEAIGVTPTPLNLPMVILLCTIVFGLSVDYEIFLLSRIKEAREAGANTVDATVEGLGRVGRIVTAAAALLTVTLFSFSIGLSFMKMFGIGTALAILLDATLVRGVLVPAFMKVAGDLNWWAPKPMLRMLDAIDRSAAKVSGAYELREEPPPRRESGPVVVAARAGRRKPRRSSRFDPGTEREAVVPISYSWLMVGRSCAGIDESHRLLVTDPKVSRDHLELRVDAEEGRAWAVDLSRYGTELNGEAMTPRVPTPLRSGDVLHLGSSTLEFRSTGSRP